MHWVHVFRKAQKTVDDASKVGARVTLCDFSKAFDKIKHQMFIDKLRKLNIQLNFTSLVSH